MHIKQTNKLKVNPHADIKIKLHPKYAKQDKKINNLRFNEIKSVNK